jgi:hypothetical protein
LFLYHSFFYLLLYHMQMYLPCIHLYSSCLKFVEILGYVDSFDWICKVLNHYSFEYACMCMIIYV